MSLNSQIQIRIRFIDSFCSNTLTYMLGRAFLRIYQPQKRPKNQSKIWKSYLELSYIKSSGLKDLKNIKD